VLTHGDLHAFGPDLRDHLYHHPSRGEDAFERPRGQLSRCCC
jgi:hypothetical protein